MKISACIIAKDEERNLPRLLRSLKGKFDEIVLVDTGSKDRTREIARSFGCKVFFHNWKGFADARNRAVKEASGDWLWHFDADFSLEEEEFRKALLALKDAPSDVEAFAIGVRNLSSDGRVKTISSHIFIHRKGIEWTGRVHESPIAKRVVGIPVFVDHFGYSDSEVLVRKAKRNLSLLLEELSSCEKGSFPYNKTLFYLVQTYLLLSYVDESYLEKAEFLAKEFLDNVRGNLSSYGFFLSFMYSYYTRILWFKGDYEELERVIDEALSLGIDLPDLYFLLYKLNKERGKGREAFSALVKVARLLDRIERNPFSLKWGSVSECILLFEEEILKGVSVGVSEEEFKGVYSTWRREKGKYLGLLLSCLETSYRKKVKLLEKLVLKYNDVITNKLFYKLLVSSGDLARIKRFSRMGLLSSPALNAYLSKVGKE
jgi:glycosyltransferase involved in cell wall biosynthesis